MPVRGIFDWLMNLNADSAASQEEAVKYLCLVYCEEKTLHSQADSPDDRECLAYAETLMTSGHLVAAEPLESVETATTVRVRNGKVSVTDGPFAETKEQLAGFYLVDARDLNEAIQLASKIPPARVGSIEVRPIPLIRETVQAEAAKRAR